MSSKRVRRSSREFDIMPCMSGRDLPVRGSLVNEPIALVLSRRRRARAFSASTRSPVRKGARVGERPILPSTKDPVVVGKIPNRTSEKAKNILLRHRYEPGSSPKRAATVEYRASVYQSTGGKRRSRWK